jgi:hypothetical protein
MFVINILFLGGRASRRSEEWTGTVIACSPPERSLPSSVWIPKPLPGGQHQGESAVSVLPAGTGATGKLRYELYSASTASRLRQFPTRLSDPGDSPCSSRSETGLRLAPPCRGPALRNQPDRPGAIRAKTARPSRIDQERQLAYAVFTCGPIDKNLLSSWPIDDSANPVPAGASPVASPGRGTQSMLPGCPPRARKSRN